jgi:hypothetical protein
VRNAHPITDHDDDVLDRVAVAAPKIVVERLAIRASVFIVVERFANRMFDLDDPEYGIFFPFAERTITRTLPTGRSAVPAPDSSA